MEDRLSLVEEAFKSGLNDEMIKEGGRQSSRARIECCLQQILLAPVVELPSDDDASKRHFIAFIPSVCIGIYDTMDFARQALKPWLLLMREACSAPRDTAALLGPGGMDAVPADLPLLSYHEAALIFLVHARHRKLCAQTGAPMTSPEEYARELPASLPRPPGQSAFLYADVNDAGEVRWELTPAIMQELRARSAAAVAVAMGAEIDCFRPKFFARRRNVCGQR